MLTPSDIEEMEAKEHKLITLVELLGLGIEALEKHIEHKRIELMEAQIRLYTVQVGLEMYRTSGPYFE